MQESKVRIVGVGGAGCRIVDRLFDDIGHPSSLVAINTDAQALGECRAAAKIQIGEATTRGFGVGGDVAAGRQAALEEKEMLRALFSDIGMAIVVAGLGGGTGTGAGPVVMEAAREEGAVVLCFVTLPFSFEGSARMAKARAALDDWSRLADAVMVAPNDRLAEFVDEPGMANAFRKVNAVLAAGMGGVEKLMAEPGLINLDFEDIRALLADHAGIGVFAYGEGRGEDKAAQALDALIGSPLLDGGRALARAEAVMLSIVGGEDMTLKEVGALAHAVSEKVGSDGKVLIGTAIDAGYAGRIALTAIVPDPLKKEDDSTAELPLSDGDDIPDGTQRKTRALQTRLKLEMPGKGRFKNVEPTIQDGQDLDIPTFVRRGIVIGKG